MDKRRLDKNAFANGMDEYGIIDYALLPDHVQEELTAEEASNDMGRVVNSEYYPIFTAWLREKGMPVDSYIVWWSW